MNSRGGPHFLGFILMNSRGGPPILRRGPPLGTISMDHTVLARKTPHHCFSVNVLQKSARNSSSRYACNLDMTTYFCSYFWLILTVRIEFWKQVSEFCMNFQLFQEDWWFDDLFQFDSKLIKYKSRKTGLQLFCCVTCVWMYDVHTAGTVNSVLGWLLYGRLLNK